MSLDDRHLSDGSLRTRRSDEFDIARFAGLRQGAVMTHMRRPSGRVHGCKAVVRYPDRDDGVETYELRTWERIANGLPSLSLNAAIHSSVPSECR